MADKIPDVGLQQDAFDARVRGVLKKYEKEKLRQRFVQTVIFIVGLLIGHALTRISILNATGLTF